MDDAEFTAAFEQWVAMLTEHPAHYDWLTLWEEAGTSLPDKSIGAIVDLYSQGNQEQKNRIGCYIDKRSDIQYDIPGFMMRTARLIKSPSDGPLLSLGLLACEMVGHHPDYRDLYIALTMLRYGAERVGIDPKPFFAESARTADSYLKPFLTYVLNYTDYNVRYSVRVSGPPEWKREAKISFLTKLRRLFTPHA